MDAHAGSQAVDQFSVVGECWCCGCGLTGRKGSTTATCTRGIETARSRQERMKPTTVNRAAKELLDNPKIAARVAELQAAAQRHHEVEETRTMPQNL